MSNIEKTMEQIFDVEPFNGNPNIDQDKRVTVFPPANTPIEPDLKSDLVDAYEQSKDNLQELRVTGGEPSRSPHFWRLLDECKNVNFDFATNSNLIMTDERLDKLINVAKEFRNFDLYTSCESYGKHAEFVRHGLNYDKWKHNMLRFAREAQYRNIHVMMTISALSVWTVKDFMLDILELRKQFDRKDIFSMSLNILRFPSFQSPLVLPDELRTQFRDRIGQFMVNHKGSSYLHEHEWNHLSRLVNYLDVVKTPHSDAFELPKLRADFKNFYAQYDQRRGKNFRETFPIIGAWYQTL